MCVFVWVGPLSCPYGDEKAEMFMDVLLMLPPLMFPAKSTLSEGQGTIAEI